ncbi:MAG TPA: ADP-ribosylglycohydrolase family protein [Phycisphaerae bacterium]|nr:ADP-ribosylglycohydrolase family protein [Phycisphaerae bacterium]
MRQALSMIVTANVFVGLAGCAQPERRLPVSEYVDKMKAGWVGQCVGVGWAGPTEFKATGVMLPADQIPQWKPELVNQWGQDDLYVEMTFLRTLEEHGLGVSQRQAGIDWANSGYTLWHANRAGRRNLRNGIAPPDSGHPKFNSHADDIDYQIEADFSGLVAPGMPNVAIELGEKFGRMMNYGDGLYGGQFVGGMYAEAFFEKDPGRIVEAGLKCIPAQSQYAECIRDVIKWHRQNPGDWTKTWGLINEKYHKNKAYRRGSCATEENPEFNIDAKLNGAYIVMGLLYGKGDIEQTIVISARCGQDSDCNPSNAAGVLFTTIGFSRLPEQYTKGIDPKGVFSHTAYCFPKLFAATEKVAREAVVKAGGRIEMNAGGQEVLVLPAQTPKPSRFEQVWEPGPVANSKFTPEEMAKITKQGPE